MEKFFKLLDQNMTKTRMLKIPDDIIDPDARRWYFSDHCYRTSALEAHKEIIEEEKLARVELEEIIRRLTNLVIVLDPKKTVEMEEIRILVGRINESTKENNSKAVNGTEEDSY